VELMLKHAKGTDGRRCKSTRGLISEADEKEGI
jgi:hypothetical protein